jgi:DNA topoisomerase-1
MARSLVVVESPSKAKTIKKYLGEGFDVVASVGHIKDLPKSEIGVDLEQGFEPHYVTIRGKTRVLKEIRDKAEKADVIYLGPDPDREGEAIAWHLAQEVRKANKKAPIHRILIHEITLKGIQDAIASPSEINADKFYSQQARRVLDRLVGYQISPILWDKVRRGLSAGRVQSVAVRLIVDREQEISRFTPEEYWSIEAQLKAKEDPGFVARWVKRHDEPALSNGAMAQAVVDGCSAGQFVVGEVIRKERRRNPPAPFTTSKLQQAAAQRLRFTAKRTMQIAQQLYEGVELGEAGLVGLITYMRTDSTRLGDEAVAGCRSFIQTKYGDPYLPAKPRVYKTRQNAQDAHEAIRPTSMDFPPETVESFLSREQFKLYNLIWQCFLACQMEAAVYDQTSIEIHNGPHHFRATGSIQTFPGYLIVYGEDQDEDEGRRLPVVQGGEVLQCAGLGSTQHFTQPPPRFNEATLVKELEERGIGRPSTYASIISTIQEKGYAEKDGARFKPTDLGTVVTDLLVQNFPQILDVGFTAQMESELDHVEEGQREWDKVLGEFYEPFRQTLDEAKLGMRNLKRESTPTDISCPNCGTKMVVKWGKNGYFLACDNYPTCKTTAEFTRDEQGQIQLVDAKAESAGKCELCGSDMIIKAGRYGRFLACSAYPTCKNTRGFAVDVNCPKCNGSIQEKRSKRGKPFYGCSNFPKCDFAVWDRPVAVPCPSCGASFLLEKGAAGHLQCDSCKAKYNSLQEVQGMLNASPQEPAVVVEAEV